MRYLITSPDQEPFMTNWFDKINNYVTGMTVYDFGTMMYTRDGVNWYEIQEDHL